MSMTYIAENPKLNERWLNDLTEAVGTAIEPWEGDDGDMAWKSGLSLMDVFPDPEEILELIDFARRSL